MTTESTHTPSPRRRRLRLTSVDAVRSYLAGCLERLEAGEIDEGQCKGRAYVCQVLVKIMEGATLEDRITALERAQEERSHVQ